MFRPELITKRARNLEGADGQRRRQEAAGDSREDMLGKKEVPQENALVTQAFVKDPKQDSRTYTGRSGGDGISPVSFLTQSSPSAKAGRKACFFETFKTG